MSARERRDHGMERLHRAARQIEEGNGHLQVAPHLARRAPHARFGLRDGIEQDASASVEPFPRLREREGPARSSEEAGTKTLLEVSDATTERRTRPRARRPLALATTPRPRGRMQAAR